MIDKLIELPADEEAVPNSPRIDCKVPTTADSKQCLIALELVHKTVLDELGENAHVAVIQTNVEHIEATAQHFANSDDLKCVAQALSLAFDGAFAVELESVPHELHYSIPAK